MIADKHTMPYLDGRVSFINKRLPYDALIEANLFDPNVYHYTPIGFKNLVKFVYRYISLTTKHDSLFRVNKYADMADKQIDDEINKFLMDNHIHVDKRELDMALSNENVVENGASRALISKVCFNKT